MTRLRELSLTEFSKSVCVRSISLYPHMQWVVIRCLCQCHYRLVYSDLLEVPRLAVGADSFLLIVTIKCEWIIQMN